MGIKQHFMALAGVGHQPEGATGAQLHVGDLHAVIIGPSFGFTHLQLIKLMFTHQLRSTFFGGKVGLGLPETFVAGATGKDIFSVVKAGGFGLSGLVQQTV
ncbi:MAG: hypothetical protein IPN53_05405 [Comamonadaceae bacterium]|nr:hypothetical protein [Comamonadaceae bacterium]